MEQKKWLLLVLSLMISTTIFAQQEVNSIEELLPYLKQNNANVKLAPGTYTVTAKDVKKGKFKEFTNILNHKVYVLFLFQGNNSTYDFTDVTINVETAVFNAFTDYDDFYEVQTIGNNNVIKNMTLVDVGTVYDYPKEGACNIVMDGANNRIEGFHVSTKGSYPYGYGETFGKGGRNVIKHYKHSACLVRGFKNHVKNTTVIHRSYGHAIFMQAADQPIIEGCYVEGEMRSSDDMLAEEGTGSDGDKAGFMTYWGYKLPSGYMMCLGEEGIRAYNGGETVINGKEYKRGTSNPTILNCTVKNMRAGVTLTHATGKKYVRGTTAIGCQRGFCIGSGDIIDCYADTQHGPALGVDYERDEGMNAEITLLPYEGKSYNGMGCAAMVIGSNHKVVLKSLIPEGKTDQDLTIKIGGNNNSIGMKGKDQNYYAGNNIIHNFTAHPLELDDNAKSNHGISASEVTDEGFNNHIFKKDIQLQLKTIK
ncbi:hypothetical protein [Flammeovirga aprica]|uniref:Right-handed parallel beta-helix repeat-containing protein n=1 Tax=Flammeovirga aprica JL-4 TaxID=694437 RepID=A0A7X9X9I0_9BACT|nr:hypothetical protein [Flammeovirga aprica]NME68789.1 hypothetical protein [Flammeovirga aprica JL-4]